MRVNSGADIQARQMASSESLTGTASATTATTLTGTGFSASSGPNTGHIGKIVAAGPNASGTGSIVFGVIVSNTTTVLTVDQWYTAGTLALGTTPNATATYQILPGGLSAFYMALTTNATAPSATDTSLAEELSGSGWTRAQCTYAHTTGASTYTLTKTFTSSDGTSRTINKMAVFNALSNGGAFGQLLFESAITSPPTLVSGDTITVTETVTI